MSDSPAELQTTSSSEPSCSGTRPPLEPFPSASPSKMESDSLARSTRESAETTQERQPWLAKPSDQASTNRRPLPTPRSSSDDAQGANSSQSSNTSRLRPCGRSLHPGHSPVGDSTRWDHSRRHKAAILIYSSLSTNSPSGSR